MRSAMIWSLAALLILFIVPWASADALDISEMPPLIESMVFNETFRDMDPDEIMRLAGPIAGHYDFIGRESESGNYRYVLGKAKGESPLAGLEEVTVRREDGDRGLQVVYAKPDYVKTNIAVYEFPELEGIWKHGDGLIVYLDPKGAKQTLGYVFSECLRARGPERIRDLATRQVSMIEPIAPPFASVELYKGPCCSQVEYFPLSEADIQRFQEETRQLKKGKKRAKRSSLLGIYYCARLDEDGSADYEDLVPEALLEMARQKCGYELTPKLPREAKLVKAHMRIMVGESDDAYELCTQTIENEKKLRQLAKLLRGKRRGLGGKCPYSGKVTLDYEDGTQITLYKATDGCDGFVMGSASHWEIGDKANAQFWKLFDECKRALDKR